MDFIVARVQAIIAGTATQLVPIQGALLAAWLGGAVLWFAWQMLHYACFMTGALRHADAASGRIRGIRVLYTTGVSGPAAAGILRKFVFLPADFAARYTVAERSLALLHEAVHHRRHDLAANVVALIVFALHWWNPVAHRAYRAYRADQELACDATVLLRLSKAGRHTYGSAMLKSAANHVPGAACALNNKDEIRRRLLGLACEPVSPSRRAFAGLATVLAMVSGLAATIGFAPAAHHERTASFHSATEAIAVRYNRRSPMPRFETATDSCRLPPLHYRGLCRSIGRHTVKFYDI
jgi:bla regulator protein BlaR1